VNLVKRDGAIFACRPSHHAKHKRCDVEKNLDSCISISITITVANVDSRLTTAIPCMYKRQCCVLVVYKCLLTYFDVHTALTDRVFLI